MKRSLLFAVLCAVAVLVGTGHDAVAAQQKEKAGAPASKLDRPAGAPTSLSGKVVETMNAGGYTYVCIQKNGKKTWVAVPEMKIKVGQEVSFQPGQEMPNFTSKSLNKTFDSIIFSGGPMTAGQGGVVPPGHDEMGQGTTGSKAAASPAAKIKVNKASGADAYTVGEVYEKRESLDTKNVTVKGKVVKVSQGIMGKNWVHVQDGSGDAKKGTHNLVVTTDDLPSVGDVVTVKGTVSKDKDFGSGYKYSVIIEKAAIAK